MGIALLHIGNEAEGVEELRIAASLASEVYEGQRYELDGVPIDSISVNLSPRQFVDANLIAVVERILHQTAIDPACLELELTEGAMSVDIEKAMLLY